MNKIPFLCLVLFFYFSYAINIYLSPTGSDTQGDGTLAKPYASLYRAAEKAAPGDRIQLLGGVYLLPENPYAFALKGTASNFIYVEAAEGAKPILDGERLPDDYSMITLRSSEYFVIQNLELRNCKGYGISFGMASNGVFQYNKIHGIGKQALAGSGDYITIQHNELYNSSLVNQGGSMCRGGSCGGWPAVIMSYSKTGHESSTNFKILNNYVHDVWGEGIISFFLQNSEVAYNRVVNSFSVGIYSDTSKNLYIHSNIVYSDNPAFDRPDSKLPLTGFSISTEYYADTENIPTNTPSNITIANNLMIHTGNGISDWRDTRNKKQSNTYYDLYIFYNVIYESVASPLVFAEVPTGYPTPTGCKIQNNIIQGKTSYLSLGNPSAWTLSNNDWVYGVPEQDKGQNEFTRDPQFVNPTISGGPEGFALKSTSQVLRAGVPVKVTTDFYGKKRSATTPTPGLWEP